MSLLPVSEAMSPLAGPAAKQPVNTARPSSGQSFEDVLQQSFAPEGEQQPLVAPQHSDQGATDKDGEQSTQDETPLLSGDDPLGVEASDRAPEIGLRSEDVPESAPPRRQLTDPSETLFSANFHQQSQGRTDIVQNKPIVDDPATDMSADNSPEQQPKDAPLPIASHDDAPMRLSAPIAAQQAQAAPVGQSASIPQLSQPQPVATNTESHIEPLAPAGMKEPLEAHQNQAGFRTIESKPSVPVNVESAGKPDLNIKQPETPPISGSLNRETLPLARPSAVPPGQSVENSGSQPVFSGAALGIEQRAIRNPKGGAAPETLHAETPAPALNVTHAGAAAPGSTSQTSPNTSAAATAQLAGLAPNDLMNTKVALGPDETADYLSSISIEDAVALAGSDSAKPFSAAGSDIPRVEMARSVGAQLVEQMVKRTQGVVDVTLNPEELGRVKMAVNSGEATVSIAIMAERPETLDLMRRHVDQLVAEFRKMGFDNVDLSFSNGAGTGQDPSGFSSQDTPWNSFEAAEMTLETNTEITSNTGPQSGLDMRL